MLPHPVLATEDDEAYIRRSILCMPERAESFFTLLERIFLEGKAEESTHAYATYHSIQFTLKVLGTVHPSTYRKSCPELPVNKELQNRIGRMRRLFLDDVVSVGPEALTWKKSVLRLTQEAAELMRGTQIKFPQSVVFIRQGISRHSVLFLLLIFAFVGSLIAALVTMICTPLLGPPLFVGVCVGIVSGFFLVLFSSAIIFYYVTAVRALQELYDRLLEERIHANLTTRSSFLQAEEGASENTMSSALRVKRGRDTKGGYYAIPYGDSVGYIEGKHVDAQVVMIGFDEKYFITRWDLAAEAMTGFLESGCIGKPLSDLVITPSGDVSCDISRLQASKGDVMKVKLRAFATAPVTLFTIAVPVLNAAGKAIGSILICANAKDNLGMFRSYIRDYATSEVSVSLSKLTEKKAVTPQGLADICSLQSFLTYASEKHVEEFAREMLTEWEWTTAEQLLGQALRSSTVQHKKYVDSMFPATLCLHPNVSKAICTVLSALKVPCMIKLQILNPTKNIFILVMRATLQEEGKERYFNDEELRKIILSYLHSTCGIMYNEGRSISFHFPSQVTAVLEDVEDTSFKAFEARSEQSVIDQTRAIVNCTVNVLTLITNLVDQHNLSMILLKTMFVSLTSVRERRDLEKRLKESSGDVDVIVCDCGWLHSARDLIVSSDHGAIVVPLAEAGVSFAPERFQYVIYTPISGSEVRKVLMDIGTAVSLRKNATTARKERERILTLRQDSPWTKGKLLGRGSFGAVYEATSDLTGGKMAVKMFYFTSDREDSINKLLNEIKIMCSLNHPNIVHYFHCERKENNVNLFMELCDTSLSDIIIGKTSKPVTLTVVQILREVLTALTYLHARGVAHRDVKPQNILLKGSTVKITDFGTARVGKTSKDVQGTLRYMAPEVYKGEAHSSPCDIWSIGCLACELFACPPKFMENSLLLAEITSVSSYLKNTPNNEALNDFLRKCFYQDPEKRPTAADLLLHPIFSPACSHELERLPTVFMPGNGKSFVFSIS